MVDVIIKINEFSWKLPKMLMVFTNKKQFYMACHVPIFLSVFKFDLPNFFYYITMSGGWTLTI